MKNVSVIIKRTPFNSLIASEALRMSVGLTLQDNKLNIIFIDDGVYLLTELNPKIINSPEIAKHIETLISFKINLIADKESMDKRGIEDIKYNVKVVQINEILDTIKNSEVIITYS